MSSVISCFSRFLIRPNPLCTHCVMTQLFAQKNVLLSFLISLMCFSHSCSSEVYKWVDDQGRVHYGDKPQQGAEVMKSNGRVSSYESVTYDAAGGQDKILKLNVVM